MLSSKDCDCCDWDFCFLAKCLFAHRNTGTQNCETLQKFASLSNEANWRKFRADGTGSVRWGIWVPPISGFHKSKIFFLKWPPFIILHSPKFIGFPAGLKVRIRRICLEVHKFENREHFLTWWLFPVMK